MPSVRTKRAYVMEINVSVLKGRDEWQTNIAESCI